MESNEQLSVLSKHAVARFWNHQVLRQSLLCSVGRYKVRRLLDEAILPVEGSNGFRSRVDCIRGPLDARL